MDSQNNVRKVLTYPVSLDKLAMYKAQKRGLTSIQSYIQYLIIKDTEDIINEIEILSDNEVKSAQRGIEDYKKGNYKSFSDSKKLQSHLDKISVDIK